MVERFMVYLTDEDTMKNGVVPSGNYDDLIAENAAIKVRLAEAERANAELNVEVSRLYACRNELQDVTQAMDDPSVNNSRDLENAIHAMKARLADAEARCCEIEARYDRLTVAYGKKCAELEEARRTIDRATQSPS